MNRLTEKDLVFVYSQQDIENNILSRMKKKHKEGFYKKLSDFKQWWNGMFNCVEIHTKLKLDHFFQI